ncbi:MAG: carbonic anhydrase [Pseudomonadota bacterium]
MDRIAAGVVKFQRKEFPKRKELFEQLARGQSPEALFIACSDSRVDPNLITQTEPGELFICRNAGNIVPPHTNHTGAMTASIEFAVGALNVPHIVVCGHTECGAMKGAMNPEGLDALPHVKEWLSYARAAALSVKENHGHLDEKGQLDELIRQNVILQMRHLATHPYVAARLAAGKVQIHGWVYDIEDGGVTAYDEEAGEFLPVAERYREPIARVIGVQHDCGADHHVCAAE